MLTRFWVNTKSSMNSNIYLSISSIFIAFGLIARGNILTVSQIFLLFFIWTQKTWKFGVIVHSVNDLPFSTLFHSFYSLPMSWRAQKMWIFFCGSDTDERQATTTITKLHKRISYTFFLDREKRKSEDEEPLIANNLANSSIYDVEVLPCEKRLCLASHHPKLISPFSAAVSLDTKSLLSFAQHSLGTNLPNFLQFNRIIQQAIGRKNCSDN